MIIGDATNVIYNGATVESVIYNGSVVWPTATPGPVPYSWSASGYTEVDPASSYGIGMPLNVRSFGWLTDTAAADTAVISGLPKSGAKYWAYSSQADYSWGKSSTEGSSIQTAAIHKNLMFDFTALCSGYYSETAYPNCITRLQLTHPFGGIGQDSGVSITSVIDNTFTSAASSWGYYHSTISGSSHSTAKSAKFVANTSQASVVAQFYVSASGDTYTYRGHAGMTATWSGSGVYVP